MRRVIPVLIATAASLALLASFHTTPGTVQLAATPVGPTTTTSTSTTVPFRRFATTAPTTSTTVPTRVIDGPGVSTRYGVVQVRATVKGHAILEVQALVLPSDLQRSARISEIAGPLLRTEALQAQSARINLVSGASYTSQGYRLSLQGALDRLGV